MRLNELAAQNTAEVEKELLQDLIQDFKKHQKALAKLYKSADPKTWKRQRARLGLQESETAVLSQQEDVIVRSLVQKMSQHYKKLKELYGPKKLSKMISVNTFAHTPILTAVMFILGVNGVDPDDAVTIAGMVGVALDRMKLFDNDPIL